MPLYPVEQVVPQRPPMMLIDEIVARAPGHIAVQLTVRPTALFFQPGRGMPAHVALEWMAQACAAFAGAEALDEKGAVRVGFLLGSRDFRSDRAWFAEGACVYVRARLEYHDAEIANFACEIAESVDGPAVASASLNVFHPRDAAALIASQPA